MVHRATTTALILLTLVVMAAPALADDQSPPEPIPGEGGSPLGGPCNIWYIRPTFPFVEVHPECL